MTIYINNFQKRAEIILESYSSKIHELETLSKIHLGISIQHIFKNYYIPDDPLGD